MRAARGTVWLAVSYTLLILSSLKNVANPDIFWHLSAGRSIWAAGALPRFETASFTRAGAAWVDFEWLSQALYAAVFGAWGWWGLIALKTGILCGAAAAVERTLRRAGAGEGARACAVAGLAAAWAINNDVRPENFSLLLFCVELAALERIRTAPTAAGLTRTAVVAAAVGAAWANFHGGFVAGLALAGVYAVFAPRRARRECAAVLAGGALGTLLTPFGAGLYGVLLAHMRDARTLSLSIVEWHWSTPRNYAAWPFWGLAGLCGAAAWRRPPSRAEAAPWMALLGLAAAAASHQRNIPFFAAAAVLLSTGAAWGKGQKERAPLAAPLCALACAVFLLRMPQGVSREGWETGKFPIGAADFLERRKAELAPLRLYNPWGWGGYLSYRLGPDYRVFSDGRYLFHGLLAEMREATRDPLSWKRFVDGYRLDLVLLGRDQPDMKLTWEDAAGRRREGVYPYVVLFMPREEWSLLYEDDLSALYVRRSRPPKSGAVLSK